MEIHRTVDGREYAFELSPEELRMAYNEMEDTYMRLDIDNMLEEAEAVIFRGQNIQNPESLSTELFKDSQRFYNDIIFRKEKMDSHVEDFQYAMEDVLSENGSDYIKLIIEEKFADKDLFFLDPNGDIRWVTYNPDSSAGGQFIDITFSQNMLKQAYASEEKNDEYILSRCSASLIDANTAGFIDYANCIAQRSPDWNDFESVINDVITKKDINNDRDSLENLHGAFKLFDEAGKGRWDMGNWGISDGAYDLWFEIYHKDIPVIDCVSGELNIVNDTHEPELVGRAFDKILEICPDLYDGRNFSNRGR